VFESVAKEITLHIETSVRTTKGRDHILPLVVDKERHTARHTVPPHQIFPLMRQSEELILERYPLFDSHSSLVLVSSPLNLTDEVLVG
jgi:hypothetical protein